jgi:DNA-binding transcriptional ArsR family regulator
MKQRRDVFFAIADENRRAILELLVRHGQPLSVGEIADDFKISRNGISKHIIVLKESGLVDTQFIGRENYVTLEAQQLAEVYQWIAIFETFWKGKLLTLKKLVESKHKKMKKEYWDVTDEQLVEKSGKKAAEWIKILDKFKAAEKKSNDVVAFLQNDHAVPRYWARTITTMYLKQKQ